MKWLQQTLAGSDEEWKIVIGHHPLYSSGRHGNTPELISRFKPVLSQSDADFYICGHDHILEYEVKPNESVHYLISGGGSKGSEAVDQSDSEFIGESPGFLLMTLSAGDATFMFYDEDGDLLYQQQMVR